MMKTRTALVLALLLTTFAGMSLAADTSSLRPPAGHKVAIVVFEDLQCPDCSRVEPLLVEAAKTYKIPLVRHDFPLPQHNWSFDAHVIARYFDTKSPALGEEFRHWIFENQRSITKANMRQMADKFAADHKTSIPLFVDPKGELTAKVRADFNLGQEVGIQHTPTIYIVSNTQRGTPFVEVVDRNQLFQLIDTMKKQAEAEAATKAPAKAPAKKPAAKKTPAS
jgi:protein-disulfide isomerase